MDEETAKAESLKSALRHIEEAIIHLSDASVALHFAGRRSAGDECQDFRNALGNLLGRESGYG
jgi:hypothetical protein